MKILYITPPWFGFRECIFDGAKEINGLPSFGNVLKELIERGNDVDFVLLHNIKGELKFNIQVPWLCEAQFKSKIYYPPNLFLRLLSMIRLKRSVSELIRINHYDFVYGHSSSSGVVSKLLHKKNIPFGQRLYGTFLWDKMINKGFFRTKLTHRNEIKSFIDKKSFLLVTNDGSRGDLVYKRLNPNGSNFDFKYWINGVNRVNELNNQEKTQYIDKLVNKPFLFYVARFDKWKQQEKAVRILKQLLDQEIDIHLYLAGPPEKGNSEYFDYVFKLIEELNLRNNVSYLGTINSRDISVISSLALASLCLYDVCNLTNVFHEFMASGACIIVRNDDVVDKFIEHDYNGYLVEDEFESVEIIKKLIRNPSKVLDIKTKVLETSIAKTSSWADRIDKEIKLIESYLSKK